MSSFFQHSNLGNITYTMSKLRLNLKHINTYVTNQDNFVGQAGFPASTGDFPNKIKWHVIVGYV